MPYICAERTCMDEIRVISNAGNCYFMHLIWTNNFDIANRYSDIHATQENTSLPIICDARTLMPPTMAQTKFE